MPVTAPDIAIFVEAGEWPPKAALGALAGRAVGAAVQALAASERGGARHPFPAQELSIVFTDDAAMRKLNARWRGKDASTNVLSFPQSGPKNSSGLLGDVILSAETLAREAGLAEKTLEDHMAHLIIHGYLHLLGFDHETEADAAKMEQLERVALKSLGIDDPYATAS